MAKKQKAAAAHARASRHKPKLSGPQAPKEIITEVTEQLTAETSFNGFGDMAVNPIDVAPEVPINCYI